jgi:hypothetical protein
MAGDEPPSLVRELGAVAEWAQLITDPVFYGALLRVSQGGLGTVSEDGGAGGRRLAARGRGGKAPLMFSLSASKAG